MAELMNTTLKHFKRKKPDENDAFIESLVIKNNLLTTSLIWYTYFVECLPINTPGSCVAKRN